MVVTGTRSLIVAFALLLVSAIVQIDRCAAGVALPWDSILLPTPLSWNARPERRANWERLEAEGRIRFDTETGNYRIAYTTCAGEERTWLFEPANKLRVEVHAEVTFDPETFAYTYTYTVRNNADSVQRMRRFAVSHEGAEIWDSMALPDDPEAEGGWYFSSRALKQDIAAWGHTEDGGLGIAQGETAVFSFKSDVPPGVVRAYVNGYVPIPRFADHEAPEDPRPDFIGQSAQGVTVGPTTDAIASGASRYVALRPLLSSLGWSLTWDSAAKQVLARRDDRTLRAVVGSNTVLLTATSVTLSRPAKVCHGRMLVSSELIEHVDPVLVSQQQSASEKPI